MEENDRTVKLEENISPLPQTPVAEGTASSKPASEGNASPKPSAEDKRAVYWIVGGVIALVALIIGLLVVLANQPVEATSHVRDIFIILMALEFLVIGAALVVLIVQLAILINLLQNEIQPIVKSTNETVSTLRGTVAFLSDNLTEPVIKMNEYLAGIKKASDMFRIWKNK